TDKVSINPFTAERFIIDILLTISLLTDNVPLTDSLVTERLLTQRSAIQFVTVRLSIVALPADKLSVTKFIVIIESFTVILPPTEILFLKRTLSLKVTSSRKSTSCSNLAFPETVSMPHN